jgi:hypothetical protein
MNFDLEILFYLPLIALSNLGNHPSFDSWFDLLSILNSAFCFPLLDKSSTFALILDPLDSHKSQKMRKATCSTRKATGLTIKAIAFLDSPFLNFPF